ncbi:MULTISPECIES: hypothetical protein [Aliarcobacter]|uniref:Uncharacterized protein n=1 Tax=Aliarcobacter butzleri TaxID=28197 RepID=A0AAW7PSC7_9BACT|nr:MULTISPECIES: hypothetical protein [Aliarcobacter]MDN5063944.1 hypothetical protein [Aliarcobacter butzleri]MDN5065178.1 hypothetical protein [Aliarcobacter butzleri]
MKFVFKLVIVCYVFSGNILFADDYVNGYYKKNGTYVKGHYRSSPNSTKKDNFTTDGNKNPYTGEKGTKKYYNYDNKRNSNSNKNYYSR